MYQIQQDGSVGERQRTTYHPALPYLDWFGQCAALKHYTKLQLPCCALNTPLQHYRRRRRSRSSGSSMVRYFP